MGGTGKLTFVFLWSLSLKLLTVTLTPDCLVPNAKDKAKKKKKTYQEEKQQQQKKKDTWLPFSVHINLYISIY